MARKTDGNVGSAASGKKILITICAVTTAIAVVTCAYFLIRRHLDKVRIEQQREALSGLMTPEPTAPPEPLPTDTPEAEPTPTPEEAPAAPEEYDILPEYEALYALNPNMIGWLRIDGTIIDYPVVQTPEDEVEYLYLDFYGDYNTNGTLIMDTDSVVGVGTAEFDYENGERPSTNLIIHGHTMKSGEMFGYLTRYEDEEYGKEHSVIVFDSLYEHREYELISVFYTQIYYPEEEAFKFYEFFQADTQEEFDYWYDNIKELALYDTGVTAELGDEFITLSCCSYQVDDGRFIVIGKRVV